MIENTARQNRSRLVAKRRSVAPSKQLRRHFVALARQIGHWAQTRKVTSLDGITVGVTSLYKGAGKSTVAFNLASALTSVNRTRVLLVESDFGNPYLSRKLGIGGQPGLTEVLTGSVDPKEATHATPMEDLFLMGCGLASDQDSLELPFELLPAMIDERNDDFGFTIFDLPLANHLSACHSVSQHLDGVILTVESSQLDRQQIQRFRSQMENFGTEIIGVVINKARN